MVSYQVAHIGNINSTYVKGTKNGCPCIVEIRGTQDLPWSETLLEL